MATLAARVLGCAETVQSSEDFIDTDEISEYAKVSVDARAKQPIRRINASARDKVNHLLERCEVFASEISFLKMDSVYGNKSQQLP